jgi:hypothetical protein
VTTIPSCECVAGSRQRPRAIAVIAHGVRRFTTDIDAAVLGDAISIDHRGTDR